MYPNLKAEMARISMTALELAELIGMPYSTLNQKLSGKSEFTVGEAFKIRKALGVNIPVEELFKRAVEV